MGAIGFTVGRFGIGSLVSLGAMVGEFYLTCILYLLSSLADRPLERHQILAFGPLHPNRIADRGGHQLVGIGIPPAR
jgi:hypothetical protein